jgi:hypothetical protein
MKPPDALEVDSDYNTSAARQPTDEPRFEFDDGLASTFAGRVHHLG